MVVRISWRRIFGIFVSGILPPPFGIRRLARTRAASLCIIYTYTILYYYIAYTYIYRTGAYDTHLSVFEGSIINRTGGTARGRGKYRTPRRTLKKNLWHFHVKILFFCWLKNLWHGLRQYCNARRCTNVENNRNKP